MPGAAGLTLSGFGGVTPLSCCLAHTPCPRGPEVDRVKVLLYAWLQWVEQKALAKLTGDQQFQTIYRKNIKTFKWHLLCT